MKTQKNQNITGYRSITEELFHENETRTNRLAGDCLLSVACLIAAFGIPICFKWVQTTTPWAGWVMIGCSLIEGVLFVRMKATGYENERTKYIMFTGMIITSGVIFFLYPLASIFLYCGPILVSIKYYDPKLTAKVSVATWAMFLLAVNANIVLDELSVSVHNMHIEQGMLLWMEIPYTIKYYVIPKSGVYLIEGVLAYMIAKAGKKLVTDQADITAKAVRMSAELNTAAKIQRSSLPEPDFVTPDGKITLSAQVITAKDVGGDFFDYFMLNDHLLVFVIADVSDKGLPAAMYAVEAQSYLRFAFFESAEKNIRNEIEYVNLEETINAVNRQLAFHNMDGMFVTMWTGCIDTRTGVGKFVNAGHCAPFMMHADGSVDVIQNEPQIFMGAFENANLVSGPLRFGNGDTLVLYTDGATDARNSADDLFGEERLKELLVNAMNSSGKTDPLQLKKEVIEGIKTFIGKAGQYDDITVMAVCMEDAELAETDSLSLMTDNSCASKVIDFVAGYLPKEKCPQNFRRKLDVIIDEVCSNISENAYKGKSGPLDIEINLGKNFIVLKFTDSGIPFDPAAWEVPDADSEPRIGGLGIPLIKSLSDHMEYRYENGKNILTVCNIWNI